MKKILIYSIVLFTVITFGGYEDELIAQTNGTIDLINNEFPEAKQEVMERRRYG